MGARQILGDCALAALLLAAPSRAQTPWIEGEARITPLAGGRNTLVVDGWAVASCGRVDLAFLVDGRTIVEGQPYLRWPGVPERFGGLPSAEYAGFSTPFDSGALGAGSHEAVVTARGCGVEKDLVRGSFAVPPRTSAWIAGPVLLVLLVAVPLALGVGLSRLEPATFRRQWTPWALAAGWFLGVFAILAGPHLGPVDTPLVSAPFAPLANWDGGWYLGIAHEGYPVSNVRRFAFFPLYPLVLRGITFLPVPERLAASLLNGLFFALAMACLRRLYPGRDHALLFVAFLPFSFFFGAVYTESLFLFLASAVLLAMREDKGLAVAGLGAAAALARVNGIATGVFALAFAGSKRRRTAVLAAAGPLAGLALWMLRLNWKTGDPVGFLHAQSAFGRASAFEPALLLDRLVETVRHGSALGFWEVGSLLAVLTGAAGLIWRRRWAEGLFSAAVVLMPLYTHSTTSLNRYALAAFPALVFLGERVSPRVLPILLGAEAALLVLWASRFGRQVFAG
jgi:hypothetical protein